MLSQFIKSSILVAAGLFVFMACDQSDLGVDSNKTLDESILCII